ncbi:MAG: amidase [Burkholderiaceae bacterium]|nr:amidase [Burkholderiaceae bacterium]MEB2317856.1 amidase [Pseudomonadota bacterium]
MVNPSLHSLSATRLAEDIRTRRITSCAVVEHFIRRIERLDGEINSIVVRNFDLARARALAADQALSRGELWGPLHGVPMTVKECFEIESWETTAGAEPYKDRISTRTAPVIEKIINAGAIIIGKTNIPAYAADAQTVNRLYGVTNNPWNHSYTPGGSSGGSAAALAAGLTPLELGSDLGGSIRMPAAFCGVTGLKPSWGIVSQEGHFAGATESDDEMDLLTIGPLSRHAEDLNLLLDVLMGPVSRDAGAWQIRLPESGNQEFENLRLAVWLDDDSYPVDHEIKDALQRMTENLAAWGARTVRIGNPDVSLKDIYDTFYDLMVGIASASLGKESLQRFQFERERGKSSPDDYYFRYARACTQSHKDWLDRRAVQHGIKKNWDRLFLDFDFMICPVTLTTAFRHDSKVPPHKRSIDVNGVETPYMDIMSWASIATLSHLPALTLPVAMSSQGLPIGVQIIAPYLHDKSLIAFARKIQEILGPCRFPLDHDFG